WGMSDCNLDYNVVAVFGSQSTGKSTLLNALFGTEFSIMDHSKRQQTTRGVWIGKSARANILVMDVEGVDGHERGDDRTVERRSALFSLATAEVLIINMMETTIGLHNGANIDLLRTVFEANMRLFRESEGCKTLLFFVIRDYCNLTPLKSHEEKLCATMDAIWSQAAKPQELKNSRFSDFFDCMFVGLPHKIFVPEQFETAMSQLRQRFIDKTSDNYVFQPRYSRNIPASGFSHYASGIWGVILKDQELDLPSHQILLAKHRCAKIYAETESQFQESIGNVQCQIDAGEIVDELDTYMKETLGNALASFDARARYYHASVYSEMREELQQSLYVQLEPLFRGQVTNLANHVVALKGPACPYA
ncbi:RHD3/Sey1, partial [Thamnocephalis sphaerospora]